MSSSPAVQNERDIALHVWDRLLLEPYRWGGDDPIVGFDCSGAAIEGLKAAGRFPRDQDDTAAGLAKRYPVATKLRRGVLVFYGQPIIHVEIIWAIVGSKVYTIGAAGGGSDTVSDEVAARRNAYVMIRPRTGWVLAVDPFADILGD